MPPNSRVTAKRTRKTTISIFAISIENPATPLAPKMYATRATKRNTMARPSKPTANGNRE